jgi:hypothetical protein
MGYVAELQQFDPVSPSVYELGAPEPATAILPPPVPAMPAGTPPRTVPRTSPRTSTASIVSHIRQPPRRRIRAGMIAGAAAVIVAGAGLAYAGLGGPDDAPRAHAPAVAASGVPGDGSLPFDPALPGAEPVAGRTAPAATSTGAPGGDSPGAVPFPGAVPPPGTPQLPGPPASPGRRRPEPVATAAPTGPGGPAPTEPVRAPVAPLPLAATFSHVADAAADGFLGYAGTVRIENPGDRQVTGWRVTLTVPGGNPVTGSGVSVAQDGETVTFTPDGDATVPAGGAVTFSFQVAGLLAALPGGCAIDGIACS